jgi:hypothetical protein
MNFLEPSGCEAAGLSQVPPAGLAAGFWAEGPPSPSASHFQVLVKPLGVTYE